MKKLIPIFLLLFCFIPSVRAAETGEGLTTILNSSFKENGQSLNKKQIEFISSKNFICSTGTNCSLDDAYSEIMTFYDSYKDSYPFYFVYLRLSSSYASFIIYMVSDNPPMSFDYYAYPYIWLKYYNYKSIEYYNHNYVVNNSQNNVITLFGGEVSSNPSFSYDYYSYYDSNFDIISERSYQFNNLFSDSFEVNIGDKFPKLIDLLNYDSWSDYESNFNKNFKTVNLDNYHSIILSLKDYSQKKAFDVNLPIKGQVGITPVYDFGQSEKSNITDRCNTNYKDFTDYRLYVLDSDLKNNALYYVKECSSGSSIKVDTSLFNITYVTDDNVNDPVVTVGGKDYHVIPFDQLSNTANKNEENGFIPGETSSNSLADIINNTTETLSSVWGSITTFMSLVTKFFNTLPIEIRTLAITTFLTSCTLGIIKIIRA